MSQSASAKAASTTQKDVGSLYLEALSHVEKLAEAQPAESDKSAWRKWARELVNYETKVLTPREKRAPRLTKYSDGAGERFLAVMKVIEAISTRLKNGDGGPSSSGESEPEETSASAPRRSARHGAANGPSAGPVDPQPAQSATAVSSTPNLTDAEKTVNYEVPCSRCARAGIACAGKEGRACFTCRAHRQRCDLSSRAIREKEKEKAQAEETDKEQQAEGGEQDAASIATGRRSSKTKDLAKNGKEATAGSEGASMSTSASVTRDSRPRRAATLLANPRVGSPKTLSQLRQNAPARSSSPSASTSAQRKRRATDADISAPNTASVSASIPPGLGPSPSKRPKPLHTAQIAQLARRDARQSSSLSFQLDTNNGEQPNFDREEVRDALIVCEAAFRQLRKALRL